MGVCSKDCYLYEFGSEKIVGRAVANDSKYIVIAVPNRRTLIRKVDYLQSITPYVPDLTKRIQFVK